MNPQIATLIQMMKAAMAPGTPRLWDVSPPEARELSARFFAPLNLGGPDMAEVREVSVPGRRGPIRARLYVPHDAAPPSPGLLFLHGGGFVIGSPETHDRLTRQLAAGSGARVLSLDYGLAPEHPFPEGLDDCVDAARWLGDHGGEIGIDPARLVIGGDSAGANLSAATILRSRDERRGPTFRGALLLYGAYACTETPSLAAWGERDLVLSRRVIAWFHDHYGAPADQPYFAPVNADLRGFPPSIIVCGTLDPLLSDSEMFADALKRAGVPVELHIVDDGIHAFVQMPMLDMATEALETLCSFAKRACG